MYLQKLFNLQSEIETMHKMIEEGKLVRKRRDRLRGGLRSGLVIERLPIRPLKFVRNLQHYLNSKVRWGR